MSNLKNNELKKNCTKYEKQKVNIYKQLLQITKTLSTTEKYTQKNPHTANSQKKRKLHILNMKKFKFTNYRKKEVNEILFFNHHTDGGMENAVHKHFLSIL